MKVGLLIAALSCASPAIAQITPQDTARSPVLNTVVVTAERARTSLSSSVASVTRIPAEELARTPHATLADVLRRSPGFAVIDFDGLGFDPQVMVRGFYGGGEAEYVVVLIDGRPVSQLQSGLVAWDVLPPLASIEAVEIVRGSTSPLYGDAAIGGVINVITRSTDAPTPSWRWNASGGSLESYRAGFDGTRVARRGPVAIGASIDRTGGFRDHAERTSGRAWSTIPLMGGADGGLSVTGRMHWRKFDEPGPLLRSRMEEDRSSSDPFYKFDNTRDQAWTLTLDGNERLGASTRLDRKSVV